MRVTCTVCNRPISRPESVEIGMGKVCRRNLKIRDRGSALPLFRARYRYWFERNVLVLTDQHGDVTLTNDMENVLAYLCDAGIISSADQKIIYRDSFGIWDGVKINGIDPILIGFYSINKKNLQKAFDTL